MDHRLRVVREEAEGAWEWHMRLVRRQARNQERREHRTAMTPRRFV